MSEDKPEGEATPAKAKPEGGTSRRRKLVLATLGMLGLAAAVAGIRYGVPRFTAARDAKRSGAALFRCLFGEPPTASETPDERLRRILLTAVSLSDPERLSTTGPGWPGRCAAHAEALADAERRRGRPAFAPPPDLATRVIEKARDMYTRSDLPLPSLWSLCDSDGGPMEVPLPPAPASPADLDAPNLAERIAFGDHSADAVPGRTLRLVFRGDRGGPPMACAFPEGLGAASCTPLAPRARLPRPHLWPAADDEGPALVADRSSARSTFYRADTGQVFGEPYHVIGGFSAAKEVVGVVEMELGKRGEERALWIDRSEGTRRLDRVRIDPPPRVRFSSVFVLGDALVWIEPRAGKPHLLLRRLGAAKGAPGAIEDAGALPHDTVHLAACRAPNGLVIVARDGGTVWMTRRDARGGSPVVRADELPRPAGAVVVSELVTCDDRAAQTTLVLRNGVGDTATHEVRRASCTKDMCKPIVLALDELFRGRDPMSRPAPPANDESPVLAASFGERLLVVWRTPDAGVRARIATPASIMTAPDIVIYDEASQDVNGAGRLHAMRLFPRGDAALLLLHAVSGIKAIRIGADGLVQPIRSTGG
ncbi:hypothetical protein [Polyangium jinanense]|uniref:Uncharacterized protein n=1 Tax=Polyangium jinanense TaxID=2829994 RepID=A0A9X3X1I8_9BACT|nr:hypothetical protein [Polyangium jinanense]MDC3954097.1 hypothetical protein [Polyangium jinanense]MDC3981947.1 hypothetical protein [Polyangium jinanense]